MPRPRHTHWSHIAQALAAQGPTSATALARRIGVSPATLHRYLHDRPDAWVATGQAARRRYALRRDIPGLEPGALPVMRIDAHGRLHDAGDLHPISPHGCSFALAPLGWPVANDSARGWWESLPYPILDMRPQGYIGRRFAQALADRLPLPANPAQWSDDDSLRVITRYGADLPGDLIMGEASIAAWHETQLRQAPLIEAHERPARYALLAEETASSDIPGSSAGGEFPKFTARREPDGSGATDHVLVKFSAPDEGSATVRRWRDLLLCEHLALEALATVPGVRVAKTQVLDHAGRRFLEVERFDRLGAAGRRPVVTLAAIDPELIGLFSHDWRAEAGALAQQGWLDETGQQSVCRQWWFGRLIANNDMHPGNLAFQPERLPQARFRPAPAYDMLPAAYAPLATGEVRTPDFQPPAPAPGETADWQAAAAAAIPFWRTVAETQAISDELRTAAAANAVAIERIRERLPNVISPPG